MSEDQKDLFGADAAAVVTAEPIAADQLTHAVSFDCTVVGGDSTSPIGYIVELKIHAPWHRIPDWIRTMSTPMRVTFAKAEGK